MELNPGNSRSSFIREYIDSWYRSVQYEPWFINISTISRKIWMSIALSVLLTLIIVIIAASVTGAGADQEPLDNGIKSAKYRGDISVTISGLKCLNWSVLNRTIHTVTIDRYPNQGLGDHNFCRNPDKSSHIWCYTNSTKNAFDYCKSPEKEAKEETSPGRKLNFDRSCDKNVTVLVENGLTLSGKYVLSTLWKGGRGVYVRIDYRNNKVTDMCMSWHSLYRHWWIQHCSFIGNNGGVAWLEEDVTCPYDGYRWRRGGTDEPLAKTFVMDSKSTCIEYGKDYNGTIVDNNLSNIQKTETPLECLLLCKEMTGCAGWSWSGRSWPCRLMSEIQGFTYNNNSVSGKATCSPKEKVGCPENHIKLDSDTCVKFLEDSTKCSDGCTRFTAKEECELAGGFLLDYLETDVLNGFLKSVGSISESIKQSFWWTGASDFSKEGKGKFTWEKSDKPVDIDPDVWVNVSSLEVAGKTEGDSHQCVYLGPVNATQVTLLDHADCRESIARPLCQFVAR